MPNQHRYPAKNFRPDPDAEWLPLIAALRARRRGINDTLRSVARWIIANPDAALDVLAPYEAIAADGESSPPASPIP